MAYSLNTEAGNLLREAAYFIGLAENGFSIAGNQGFYNDQHETIVIYYVIRHFNCVD